MDSNESVDHNSESTLGLVLKQMQQDKADILKEIQAGRIDTANRIESLRTEVDNKFSRVDQRVAAIESSMGGSKDAIDNIQAKLDEIEQARLSTQMDITGVNPASIPTNQRDLRSFVHNLINSYKITVPISDIHHAYSRPVGPNKCVIVVVFASVMVKSFVMQEKRKLKDDKKIFFDHRLTPKMRTLYWSARSAVKNKRAQKAFIASGRVMLEQLDGSKSVIRSPEDLDSLPPPVGTSSNPQRHQKEA